MTAIIGALQDAQSGLNDTTNVTASGTALAGALQLVAVAFANTTGVGTPALSGLGRAWTQIGSVVNIHDTVRGIALFRSLTSVTAIGAVTIAFGAAQNGGIGWVWQQFRNVNRSGSNGAGAIRQSATGVDAGSTVTSGAVALSSFGDSVNNAAYAFCGVSNGGVTMVGDSGYSLDQLLTSNIHLGCEYKIGEDLSVSMSWNTGQFFSMIGLEIVAGPPFAGGTWPYDRGGRTRRTRLLAH